MNYISDKMRVEMSLPVHMMLAVLLSGSNTAEPPAAPRDASEISLAQWRRKWSNYRKRIESDEEFAHAVGIYKETKELLLKAIEEPLEGIYPPSKETALLRRIERIHIEIAEPYVTGENADPRKIGIITYYLLQHLVDTGILIVGEDSSFGKALDTMLPALSPPEVSTVKDMEDYDKLNISARKHARKVLQNLQNEGYYKDIPLPDYH